jgi:hypothetical protein
MRATSPIRSITGASARCVAAKSERLAHAVNARTDRGDTSVRCRRADCNIDGIY